MKRIKELNAEAFELAKRRCIEFHDVNYFNLCLEQNVTVGNMFPFFLTKDEKKFWEFVSKRGYLPNYKTSTSSACKRSSWKQTDIFRKKKITNVNIWNRTVPGGFLYVKDSVEEHFYYLIDCGIDSKYNTNGTFKQTKIKSVEEAKLFLDDLVKIHFNRNKTKSQLKKERTDLFNLIKL